MGFFLKLRKKLGGLWVSAQRWLGYSVTYQYDRYSLALPPGHLLPLYRKLHPRYDAFLPHLVAHLGGEGVVVDVGANVGDTLAGMAETNASLKYVCVEPDDEFYKYLLRNVQTVSGVLPGLKVEMVKALVGRGVRGAELKGQGGTKSAIVTGAGGLQSRTLDELLSATDRPRVRLIKSDVDGFDFDVILSAESTLRESGAILYFECHFSNDVQRLGFERLFDHLVRLGYCNWVVFDNYGSPLLRTSSRDVLRQLMDYVQFQNQGRGSRTIYYYDMLTFQSKDASLMDEVVAKY